jgi:hypothetical protein
VTPMKTISLWWIPNDWTENQDHYHGQYQYSVCKGSIVAKKYIKGILITVCILNNNIQLEWCAKIYGM